METIIDWSLSGYFISEISSRLLCDMRTLGKAQCRGDIVSVCMELENSGGRQRGGKASTLGFPVAFITKITSLEKSC